ncbi:MAG: hypothetical protein QXF32_02230 [Candidatus Thermoplasmatota archaeon]
MDFFGEDENKDNMPPKLSEGAIKHIVAIASCNTAREMVYENRIEEAMELLKEAFQLGMEMTGFRADDVFSSVASVAFIAGKKELAFEMVEYIKDAHLKIHRLLQFSNLLWKSGNSEKALEILEDAEIIIREIMYEDLKAVSIYDVANAYLEKGLKDKALNLVHWEINIGDYFDSMVSQAYAFAAENMVKIGKIDDALNLLKKIKDAKKKANLLAEIAYIKKDKELIKKAARIARKVEDEEEKFSVIGKIAIIAAKIGDKTEAERLINECIRNSEKIDYELGEIDKTKLLAITAHAMFENGDERYKEIMYEVIKMAKELEKKKGRYRFTIFKSVLC